ncbi:MAG TPA: hypothetical protein PKY82_00875 [Pyrinomonadaceae bacterium]|nr:hypothetical protein [Pyrinomonadaceae bacterium]
MRTVPMPSWAKTCMDVLKRVSQLEDGFVFRRVNKGDNLMDESITPQAIRKASHHTIFTADLPNSPTKAVY